MSDLPESLLLIINGVQFRIDRVEDAPGSRPSGPGMWRVTRDLRRIVTLDVVPGETRDALRERVAARIARPDRPPNV